MTSQTAPAERTAALFANLTDCGWVRLDARGVKHWAENNRLLCGLKPPPELFAVLGQDALSWNEHVGACRVCVSELIRRTHALPFRVGQRVISRAHGMVLRGKIERFFLGNDHIPLLDITREWVRPPEEVVRCGYEYVLNDTHAGDWYRAAHECKLLEDQSAPSKTRKPAPSRNRGPQ